MQLHKLDTSENTLHPWLWAVMTSDTGRQGLSYERLPISHLLVSSQRIGNSHSTAEFYSGELARLSLVNLWHLHRAWIYCYLVERGITLRGFAVT